MYWFIDSEQVTQESKQRRSHAVTLLQLHKQEKVKEVLSPDSSQKIPRHGEHCGQGMGHYKIDSAWGMQLALRSDYQ